MTIGIDGNEANEVRVDIKERVGVNQYAFELLHGLYKMNRKKKVRDKFVIYLKNNPANDLPKEQDWWRYKVLKGGSFWIIKNLTPALFVDRKILDIFFSPSHYLPFTPGIKKIFTIHDLGYLDFSGHLKKRDFWQLKYWTAKSISISNRIISVSKSTRNDIVRRYPSALGKVDVVHHGVDHTRYKSKFSNQLVRRTRKKYAIQSEYILFLSTLKPSKNVDGLIRAVSTLKNKKYELIIGGKKGWAYESLKDVVNELDNEIEIKFVGYVSDADKPILMQGAKVFVSPSYWEGFGMHVLEAMSCGTPVVVSKVASLPEVVGSAGVYVDPNDTRSIANGIIKILSLDNKQYNKLSEVTIEQAMKFDWMKTAKQTMKIFRKIK